ENLRGTEQPATIVVADAATDAAAVRREAVRALVAMEGSGAERLPIFAELLRRGVDRDLAVAGIDTVLATGGNVSDPAALAAEILRFARDIPTADRAGPTFTRAAALGDRLASMLPAAEGARVATAFDILLPKLLQIRALEGAMRFDINDFSVEAGREVEIVFQNPDIMPHNLVVTQPGSVETVGRAADAMASQADAYEKDFVPDLPAVLFATRLINPGERVTLSFQAPSEPGEYPFICTFP